MISSSKCVTNVCRKINSKIRFSFSLGGLYQEIHMIEGPLSKAKAIAGAGCWRRSSLINMWIICKQ